jgi:hypothetical protein
MIRVLCGEESDLEGGEVLIFDCYFQIAQKRENFADRGGTTVWTIPNHPAKGEEQR